MERKIGEKFELGGKTYITIESLNACDGCIFEDTDYCVFDAVGECLSDCRSDGKSVIFKEVAESDRVQHPSHYTWLKEKCGVEVIDITRHMNFNLGNCIKYILRSGHKSEEGMSDKEKAIEDLMKAKFYIEDEINRLKKSNS